MIAHFFSEEGLIQGSSWKWGFDQGDLLCKDVTFTEQPETPWSASQWAWSEGNSPPHQTLPLNRAVKTPAYHVCLQVASPGGRRWLWQQLPCDPRSSKDCRLVSKWESLGSKYPHGLYLPWASPSSSLPLNSFIKFLPEIDSSLLWAVREVFGISCINFLWLLLQLPPT